MEITQNLDKEMQEKFINVTASLTEEGISQSDVRTKAVNLASGLDKDSLYGFINLVSNLKGGAQSKFLDVMGGLQQEARGWFLTAAEYIGPNARLDNILNRMPNNANLDQVKQTVRTGLGLDENGWKEFDPLFIWPVILKVNLGVIFLRLWGA